MIDPIKKAEALFLDDDELNALLEGANSERGRIALAALNARCQISDEKSQRRRKNPWLLDLIRVLLPRKQMHTQAVIQDLWKRRKDHGFEPPKEFRNTVQSAYNSNCDGYSKFEQKRKKNPEFKPLFYSPEGKGTGIWAVHRDRAFTWLKSR
jgi:hypothetical protein